jgi:hypothetical protein
MVKSISIDYSFDDKSEDVDVCSCFRGWNFWETGIFGRCDGDECGVTWQICADHQEGRHLTRIEMRNNPRDKDGNELCVYRGTFKQTHIKLEYKY